MTRLLPEELKEGYWKKSKFEQDSIWSEIIAKGLGIDITTAKRKIEELRQLPLRERLKDATLLLAEASNGFIPYDRDGNRMNYRGPKPILASDSNAVRLAGASYTQRAYWHIVHSEICENNFLIKEHLTAANLFDWTEGTGVEFSNQDVFTGIYIPPKIDAEAAQALGIIQADGIVKKSFGVYLTGRTIDRTFYRYVVPLVFAQAFNIIQEEPYLVYRDSDSLSSVKTYRYRYPVATFYSKALTTYLQMLGFPTNRAEARIKRIPSKIRELNEELKHPFVVFYLAARAHRNKNVGNYPYVDILSESEAELRDFMGILSDLGVSGSIRLQPQNHSYLLHIGSGTVDRMWEMNLFDENPTLREELKPYFRERVSKPRLQYR